MSAAHILDTDDRIHVPEGSKVPDGLLAAFWNYERALMTNDLESLDALFATGPDTIRGDAGGVLFGHDTISAFRRGRGGAPARTVLSVEVRLVGPDAALIVAITAPITGGRGQQTQLWRLGSTGWVVDAAHVSLPAPAIAGTIWRIVGAPLVDGSGAGALHGQTVAVKDLFSVAGFPVGAGVPAFLAEAETENKHADCVAALLKAGAVLQGIARTDEFAYSVAGRNPHYGTPPNGAVPGALPGGSSSGPASAVATGQATIGLATDTGGSIRVPASYQGLWGLRTTHGAVGVGGLLPLAPTFDTVGWLTRDAETLTAAASSSLDAASQTSIEPHFVIAPDLTDRIDVSVRTAFAAALQRLENSGWFKPPAIADFGDLDELFETFRVVQGAEAWRNHGEWIKAHPGQLGADVAARFALASTITAKQEAEARAALAVAASRINDELGERILLLPSASSAGPSSTADSATIELTRGNTLRLTCLAGISGRPGLSVPAMSVGTSTAAAAPVGLGLVGPRHSDLALIEIGSQLNASLKSV